MGSGSGSGSGGSGNSTDGTTAPADGGTGKKAGG
jgi:hypothetical protein